MRADLILVFLFYFFSYTMSNKPPMPPQTIGAAIAQLENYIEPDYEVGTDYRDPREIRIAFNEFFEDMKTEDFGDENNRAMIPKNGYAFNAHLGQAARYLDAAKDEYAKAVLAAYCVKKQKVTDEATK